MDRITFEIFKPDGKKFRWTPDTIFLIFWLIPVCFHAIFQSFVSDISWLRDTLVFYEIFGLVLSMGCLLASFFLHEPLKGVINGKIEFGNDFIKVNDERFELKEITGLDFVFSDYYDQPPTTGRSLNPKISQDIRNHVTFKDKDNKTHLVDFRLPGKHSYLSLSGIINEAVKMDKIHIYRAEDLIGKENIIQ